MQILVIVLSAGFAIFFIAIGLIHTRKMPWLVVPVLMLVALATYESYVHFIWEPTVIAPIRIDLFFEIPVMVFTIIIGSIICRIRRPKKQSVDRSVV